MRSAEVSPWVRPWLLLPRGWVRWEIGRAYSLVVVLSVCLCLWCSFVGFFICLSVSVNLGL